MSERPEAAAGANARASLRRPVVDEACASCTTCSSNCPSRSSNGSCSPSNAVQPVPREAASA
eukprot:4930854-Pyramimonas_sp.AAC.1